MIIISLVIKVVIVLVIVALLIRLLSDIIFTIFTAKWADLIWLGIILLYLIWYGLALYGIYKMLTKYLL